MSEPIAPDVAPAPVRARRTALLVVSAVGVAVVAATAILYTQRGAIGARLAVDYLEGRGVPAVIHVERLGPRGFTGSAILGPPGDPDLTIERIEVEFGPLPILRGGLAPRVLAIRITRPDLKARWADGELTFGSLQPLVEEFLGRPATGPSPEILIEAGTARIATAAGVLRLTGGGQMSEGRIVRVDGRMGPQRLAAGGRAVEIRSAAISLRGSGNRLAGRLEASLPRVSQPDLVAEGLVASAALDLPYGATPATLLDGRLSVQAQAGARRLDAAGSGFAAPRLDLRFQGTGRGPFERLSLIGGGRVEVGAESMSGAAAARGPRLVADLGDLSIARAGEVTRFSFALDAEGGAERLTAGGAVLTRALLAGDSARLEGEVGPTGLRLSGAPSAELTAQGVAMGATRATGVRLDLGSTAMTMTLADDAWRMAGPLETHGTATRLQTGDVTLAAVTLDGRGQGHLGSAGSGFAWRGSARSRAGTSPEAARRLAASLAAIAPDQAALARALRTMRLDAPDLRIDALGSTARVGLAQPLRLVGEGAEVVVTARRGATVATAGGPGLGGALSLTARGAAIPELALDVPSYRIAGDGLRAETRATLSGFDFAALREVRVETAGRIAPVRGGVGFTPIGCVQVTAERMEGMAEPIATDLKGDACPDGGRPLLITTSRGWVAHARLDEAGLRAPVAEVEVSGAEGLIDIAGGPAGLTSGSVRISAGTITDRAAEPRFLLVRATGGATLQGGDTWIGRFFLAEAAGGRRLGEVGVSHEMTTGQGVAEIDATELVFAKDGLQPAHITPIAAGVITDAEGPAAFTGRAAWSESGLVSSGRASTTGLDFTSSLGAVDDLRGEVVFSSLAPLTTETDQDLTIEHIDWLVPLDDARFTLTLTPTEVKITRAQVSIGGGQAVLDPVDLKLGEILPTSGVLRLADIDINRLLSEFNLSDKVTMEAKVDGILPFAFTDAGVRFTDGRIFADGPGRLSIKREAITGIAAEGEAGAPPNAMQSFAYQAMENLAFSTLDARISSQPQGRLGILFHIVGRHDPEVARTPRVSITDLLQGRAFDQDLPLPKGTPVDLTLDTSLNFDELLAAYTSIGRSTPVQP